MIKTYILGNPRSGTSLFRLMLNQHSQVVAPPESGFALWWYAKYKNWAITDNSNLEQVERFVHDVSTSKKIETWELDYEYLTALIQREQPKNYSDLICLVYCSYHKELDIKVIADKNNYYIKHLEELPLIWPDARYIHVLRDGRDVACSYLDMTQISTASPYKPQLNTNIAEIAKEWSANCRNIIDVEKKLGSKVLTVKFEDLINSSVEILNEVCAFLDIPFESKMLQYYEQESPKLTEPAQTFDWKAKTKEKPDPSRVGRYRKDLTPKQVECFNQEAGEMLRFFNYE